MNEQQLVEHLAAGVHQAWMQEKQRQGFVDHVWDGVHRATRHILPNGDFHDTLDYICRKCDKPPDKHHTDIVAYEELPEHIKEYDRVTVKRVLLELARYLEGIACEF